MSEAPESLARERAAVFRRALADCERLYGDAAQEALRKQPHQVDMTADEFRGLVRDLSHGLVLKIFVEVAQSDWHWSYAERQLAIELFEFVWHERIESDHVRDALETIVDKASDLTWSSLVRPFERLPAFKSRIGELEALATRVAQLVAKIDGTANDEELRRIAHIQSELARNLRPVDIDEKKPPADVTHGTQAIEQAKAGAQEVRTKLQLQSTATPLELPKARADRLAEALAELNGLIGLAGIKREVEELVNFLKIEEERATHGLPRTKVSLHMTFAGNPGTGKTSVARLLGKIYGAMGVLTRGHLVETDRSGLVAEYAGQTGPKTHKKIDEALDGVLFIDEAYSLVSDSKEDPYGTEAVQSLLKRMEDDRSRLIVILAGYPAPMERLIRTNPGLQSRFSRQLSFPDYTAEELGRILERMCVEQRYRLSPHTRLKLLVGFQSLLDRRDERFGNGRLARNLFETAIRRMANRIVMVNQKTTELLTPLEPDDILIDELSDDAWRGLLGSTQRLVMVCPGCRHPARFPAEMLGQPVRCNRCGQKCRADWGELAR